MYEYIKGYLTELSPTTAVVEANGFGYSVNISLNTYSFLQSRKEIMLYLHFVVREDAQMFFGFATKKEREVFRLLISVSGIGVNTARVMLSSLTSDEVISAISTENVNVIKSVKGIGIKTAQRVIIELKDKIAKETLGDIIPIQDNSFKDEALSALVMLGFVKASVSKVLDKIIKSENPTSVESMIKLALKML